MSTIDDFENADTPRVVTCPRGEACPLAAREVRRHWLSLLAPGGALAKLAVIVDGTAARLAAMDSRLRLVVLIVGALAGVALGFAAGWAAATCARLL